MIRVDGHSKNIREVRLTKKGKTETLTPNSDPKDLFNALHELARYIVRNKK